jgi:hypothetical protein
MKYLIFSLYFGVIAFKEDEISFEISDFEIFDFKFSDSVQ